MDPKLLFKAIESADVVHIKNDDGNYIPVSVTTCNEGIKGDDENQVFNLEWGGGTEYNFGIIINEYGLKHATVNLDGEIHLEDYEGEPTVIKLFKLIPLVV